MSIIIPVLAGNSCRTLSVGFQFWQETAVGLCRLDSSSGSKPLSDSDGWIPVLAGNSCRTLSVGFQFWQETAVGL